MNSLFLPIFENMPSVNPEIRITGDPFFSFRKFWKETCVLIFTFHRSQISLTGPV